jgi:hypothetical protein
MRLKVARYPPDANMPPTGSDSLASGLWLNHAESDRYASIVTAGDASRSRRNSAYGHDVEVPPWWARKIRIAVPASSTPTRRNATALTTLNTAVLTAIARPRPATVTTTTPGLRRNRRIA